MAPETPDDGILSIPVYAEGKEKCEMDEQIKKQMEQSFATHHEHLNHTANRFNDGSAFAAQESKQGYLLAKGQVGADALNKLEQDGSATLAMLLKNALLQPVKSA